MQVRRPEVEVEVEVEVEGVPECISARGDMQPGTPETEAKGLLKSIEHLPTIL